MDLGTFEGLPVVRTGIEIPKAGGGLHEAMKIDPVVLHHGQRVQIVLEGVVKKVRHDPASKKDEDVDEVVRIHVIEPDNALLTDDAGVGELLASQRDRIQQAKDAANGQSTVESQLLDKAHGDGDHASARVDGCAQCDLEAELAEIEDART